MTLPPSRGSSSSVTVAGLDYEIAHEQAGALGRLGRALEAALAALSAFDHTQGSDHAGDTDGGIRSALIRNASDALWCFLVQRECCGLRDPRPVMRDYAVPAEVFNRIGVIGPGAASLPGRKTLTKR